MNLWRDSSAPIGDTAVARMRRSLDRFDAMRGARCRRAVYCTLARGIADVKVPTWLSNRRRIQRRSPPGESMKIDKLLCLVLLAAAFPAGYAADAQVKVIVGGEISPGVYGRVEIGTAPPPRVLYPKPVVVVPPARGAVLAPIYLHVPPGHAKHWAKHCRKYNACGQRVYFVRSAEYEPGYGKKTRRHGEHDDDKGRGKARGRGHRD